MQSEQFGLIVPAVILFALLYWWWLKNRANNRDDYESLNEDNSTSRETSEQPDDLHCIQVHGQRTSNVLDLHRSTRLQAIEAFEQFLRHHRQLNEHRRLRIITGWGKLSPNNIPVIKPAILEYLSINEPRVKIDHRNKNEGCIVIYNIHM